MDIELSAEDLSFREEVRQFFSDNEYPAGEDYMTWRTQGFEKARQTGGWDVPKWPADFGGPGWTPPQHYTRGQESSRRD